MPLPKLVTSGDDLAIVQDLYESGLPVNVSAASIVACVQDGDGCLIIASTAQSSSAAGAAWATGRVVCEFAATASASLAQGSAWLQISVTRSGKRTTWPLFEIEVQASAL